VTVSSVSDFESRWAKAVALIAHPSGVWFSTARAAAMVAKGEQPPGSSVPPGGYTKGNWLSLEMEMGSEERAMADKLRVRPPTSPPPISLRYPYTCYMETSC
jgi:hypothetical protein